MTQLKSIFSRHGIPETMISDNGPPFNSKEFHLFTIDWNIKHINSSPYFSRSNGMVERTIGTVKHI
ncbi:transposase family protein, partial [Pseudomonas aeruginosa]